MSMHLKYTKLFSVATEIVGNPNMDPSIFSFTPTLDCTKLFAQFGMVANGISGGIAVYYKTNENQPTGDKLAGEITSTQSFLFVIKLQNKGALTALSNSFSMGNGPNFYINNLNGTTIKTTGSTIHIDGTLGDKDNVNLVCSNSLGELGRYSAQRISDAAPRIFDARTKTDSSKPFGVMEIQVKDSQLVFNNIEYKIKLN